MIMIMVALTQLNCARATCTTTCIILSIADKYTHVYTYFIVIVIFIMCNILLALNNYFNNNNNNNNNGKYDVCYGYNCIIITYMCILN